MKFLKVCKKIDSKAKNKYFKLFLYGIIIVTKDTYIYMKQNNQNQIIYFFPDPLIGGVEKNFLISNIFYIFNHNFLITNFKIIKNLIKKIKLLRTIIFGLY